MKVIHIMDTIEVFGGVNSFVYDLCKELNNIGIDVSIIGILSKNKCQKLMDEFNAYGISVFCLEAKSKIDAVLYYRNKLRKLIREISGHESTIINLHLRLGTFMGCISTSGLNNIVCVETYHSKYPFYYLQYILCKRRINKYIGCSITAKDEFASRFQPEDNKLIAIPNGVNGNAIRKIAGETQCSTANETVFLSVGRFTKQKNFLVSTEAYIKAGLDRTKYIIIGSGLEEKALREKTKKCKSVIFTGSVDRNRVLVEIRSADMVVMPSLWEGLSIFMLETITLGCPLMISNEAALRSVMHESSLTDGESWRRCNWGYLVETSNVEAYAEAMKDYVNNPYLRESMQSAVQNLAAEYDIRNCACKYRDLYYELAVTIKAGQ